MGGNSVAPPPPDPAQQALEQQQTQLLQQQMGILKQQTATQNLLAPYIYQQFGLTPQKDASGNITGFTQDPAFAANAKLGQQVETQALQQESDALAGKLPINSAVEATLNQNQANLGTTFSNAMGPGYQSSTGYQNALNKFLQYRGGIEQAAQQGQMSLADQMAAAGAGTASSIAGGNSSGIAGTQAGEFGLLNAMSGVNQGFSSALNPYLAQQQMGLSGREATAQQNMQQMNSILSLIGGLGGAGIAAMMM